MSERTKTGGENEPVAPADADLRGQFERLEQELRRRSSKVTALEETVAAQRRTIQSMEGTMAWRVAASLWRLRDRVLDRSPALAWGYRLGMKGLKEGLRPVLRAAGLLPPVPVSYQKWISRNALGRSELAALHAAAARSPRAPLFSVLVPVHDIAEPWLRSCIESVLRQEWSGWELCAVDDGSRAPHVWPVLQEHARRDDRVRIERTEQSGGIVAATRRALAMARGDFVAFLDHDDELAPEALLAVAAKLGAEPDLDLVYSDEDKLDEQGRRIDPFFKPSWSPDLLLSMNYVSHLTVARRKLVEEVGGLRPGFDGSQDYDLLLRLVERTDRIGHVPRVLYHWRRVPGSAAEKPDAKPYALDAARRALEEALERRDSPGRVVSIEPGRYRARCVIRGEPLVSIIMPTRDKAQVLRTCVESIEASTTWRRWELVVVDNGSSEPDALACLEEIERRHRVVRDARPFNWSALNNGAARVATGECLLFMNNDMQVIDPEWMEAMIEHVQRPEVGAVGARLLYPDGRVQHAGVVLGVGGLAGHAFKYLPGDEPGYLSLGAVVRNVSAVTGACLMTRRDVFDGVGGFDERLPVAYNDIDFCLRVLEAGKLVVYTPFARLYHYESATRGPSHPKEADEFMWSRWGDVLRDDPYYSPNLTRRREDYGLRA